MSPIAVVYRPFNRQSFRIYIYIYIYIKYCQKVQREREKEKKLWNVELSSLTLATDMQNQALVKYKIYFLLILISFFCLIMCVFYIFTLLDQRNV